MVLAFLDVELRWGSCSALLCCESSSSLPSPLRSQGQFASKAFDGDPYIEIMRVLPDKELCWWIQKVIWVSASSIAWREGRSRPPMLALDRLGRAPTCAIACEQQQSEGGSATTA